MRTLSPLVVIAGLLLALGSCREHDDRVLLRAGQDKSHVRARLLTKRATKINDLVSIKMKPWEDWWVTHDGTCLRLLYDGKLKLLWIVVGAPKRGFKTKRDWELQSKERCKQYYLE